MVKLPVNHLKHSIDYKSISLATTVQTRRNGHKLDWIHKLVAFLSFFEQALTAGQNSRIFRDCGGFRKAPREAFGECD